MPSASTKVKSAPAWPFFRCCNSCDPCAPTSRSQVNEKASGSSSTLSGDEAARSGRATPSLKSKPGESLPPPRLPTVSPSTNRTKPPFPPPVDEVRVTIRRGRTTPHPSHELAVASEEARARFIHSLPDEVVILWGKKIGKQGSDVISYNLRTKRLTVWDDKYRSDAVMIYPSRTFTEEPSLTNALAEAKDAIWKSALSDTDKEAAIASIQSRTFNTRTVGSGNARNSTFGDHQ